MRLLGILAILSGILVFGLVVYLKAQINTPTRLYSPNTLLNSSWEKYKEQFINADGRVIDHSQNGTTTSEGQSYAMLRSVWIDDKDTFDKVWAWTKDNLKRSDDNLFGWRWGSLGNDDYGFLPDGGNNSASDADTDIAYALLLAHRRWRQQPYLDAARPILIDLWEKETTTLENGKRVLIAGNWAQNNTQVIVNPSYFAPYAWRLFAELDKDRPWNSLIDPAYEILMRSSDNTAGLPPNWIAINRDNFDLVTPPMPNLTTDYSFDAMRVPWRIALDHQLYDAPPAKEFLSSRFSKLSQDLQTEGKIYASYRQDGSIISQFESPTMYATAIGHFLVANPALAKKIYDDKIISLYSNDTNSFNSDLPYYDQNWLWFGAALFDRYLTYF